MLLKGTPTLLKLVNQNKIERFIRANGTATKPQIASATNISLVTVTKLVDSLLEEGKIMICGVDESTGGRHAQRYKINPNAYYFVVIYYLKGFFRGAIADATGETVLEKKFPSTAKDADSLFIQLCDAIDTLIHLQGQSAEKTIAIGIGVPGVEKDGIINSIPSLPLWENFPLIEKLELRYDLPIFLENDINLAVLGLYTLEYRDTINDMMLIYLDEGVGAGIILDSSLYRGNTNFAGELGYLPIEMPRFINGPTLPDKQRLEVAIKRIYRKIEENDCGIELYKALCNVLSQTIISVVSVLNPEVIAIKSTFLGKEAAEYIKELVSNIVGIINTPEIILIPSIEEYCLHGAIRLCMNRTDINPRISYNKNI